MQNDTILTLHLHAPLAYRGQSPSSPGFFDPSLDSGRTIPVSEGMSSVERIIVFSETACLTMTEEGPRAQSPFAIADFAGLLDTKASLFEPPDANSFILKKGVYLFYQTEASDERGAAEALEFFAREAWWAREECAGPFILRFVDEDGHTALQVIRAIRA